MDILGFIDDGSRVASDDQEGSTASSWVLRYYILCVCLSVGMMGSMLLAPDRRLNNTSEMSA